MSDQKANRIVQLSKGYVFALVGPPSKLHSNHGRTFDSRILSDLCLAFGVKKCHTTMSQPAVKAHTQHSAAQESNFIDLTN